MTSMDFSPIVREAWGLVGYFLPLFLTIALFKTAWFKGVCGEGLVNLAIRLFLRRQDYHRFSNVTLPLAEGSTQIDHIIVSRYGLFVIETKNMKGWIFGFPSQPQWTQKIYRHSQPFQNPLHQNYKHIKALQDCLGLAEGQIFSLVVFAGDAEFKTAMPDNVTHLRGMIRYIRAKRDMVFSEQEVRRIMGDLQSHRLPPGWKTHAAHVRHVKSLRESKPSRQSCPLCGQEMVIREAKKGSHAGQLFWGCSTYPRCKGTVKINPSHA